MIPLHFKKWYHPSIRPSEIYTNNKEAHMRTERKPSFRRKHKVYKKSPCQRPGLTMKVIEDSEHLLLASWQSEHSERGEPSDSELTPTRIPHFLGNKIN